MARPTQQTPERAALAAAHEQRAAARAALVVAETAYEMAARDYEGARFAVDEIGAEIRHLKATRTYGLPNVVAEVNEKLAVCYSRHDTAAHAIPQFASTAAEAKARLDAASYPALTADHRVSQAAAAAARAEAEPLARDALARVREAFAVILRHGPDLVALIERELAPPDIAHAAQNEAGGLLGKARTGWPEFNGACQASPWRTAQRALEADPQA